MLHNNKFHIKHFLLVMLAIFGLFSLARAQDMYNLENDLFKKLITYHKLQFKADSLNEAIKSISRQLNELKKNKTENEETILTVLSTSVSTVNELKVIQKNQSAMNDEINLLRRKLYNIYEARIDSLTNINKSNPSEIISQLILDLTDKKLLVQPKIGILSIDPLRLLNINITSSSLLPKDMIREYFTNAIDEVNSHLEVINKSLDETEEIIKLREQTQNFLEESSFETETRPMNLFSTTTTETTTPDGYTADGTRGSSLEALNAIKNTTLLGADTFAAILKQLSSYDNAAQQNRFSRYNNTDVKISLEDYSKLLKETKLRLEEYRTVLLKRINLFNESD